MLDRRRKWWAALVGAVLLTTFAVLASADEPEPEPDPIGFARTDTSEGYLRLDLPAANYICRFETWYDIPVVSYPSGLESSYSYGYFEARAWLFDEDHGYVVPFEIARGRQHKLVSILSLPEDAEGREETIRWANSWNQFSNTQLSNQWIFFDDTPRLEVSLSRGFRNADFEWTFKCGEILWPESE